MTSRDMEKMLESDAQTAGAATAFALLIEMPELGTLESREAASLAGLAPVTLESREAASLAGLAPVTRESGQWKGRSFGGGRSGPRQALYMPALAAIRFNAGLKAKYQSPIAAGKPPKAAIPAVMRKPIGRANALLKDRRTWTPKLA
jgi:transposase